MAAAAHGGIQPDAAIERSRQMDQHLPGNGLDTAVIVANQLFAEHRPVTPGPTYLFAIETPDHG